MKSLPLAVPHMNEAEAEEVFGWILDGEASDQEIARFLLAMTERSETADEIAGAARALRARYIPVEGPDNAIDVCGTGGDGQLGHGRTKEVTESYFDWDCQDDSTDVDVLACAAEVEWWWAG